jgi:hypothetical protein
MTQHKEKFTNMKKITNKCNWGKTKQYIVGYIFFASAILAKV